ncbi:MAG TPA: branched-chain amino acid ABC transporter permease, partial [Verrucomicrobiae bacterium]|nr:branched-chain amino acid ABC transporter permease [Verrucomicrobiae bacterium]
MSALPLPPTRVLRWAVPILAALVLFPWVVEPYQTTLFSYGLVMAIAALGFNLLLGYTGLLSFGQATFFGSAAYVAGYLLKH